MLEKLIEATQFYKVKNKEVHGRAGTEGKSACTVDFSIALILAKSGIECNTKGRSGRAVYGKNGVDG